MYPIKPDIDMKQFTGLTCDSRDVRDGYLFAALSGVSVDGADFIGAALENGASAVLAQSGVSLPEMSNAMLISDDNPRLAFAHLAAEFYPVQPEYITAVTGTNGKTSVVHFTAQLWNVLGESAASIGTLGLHSQTCNVAGSMTTPDAAHLHEQLAELAQSGATHLAIEASSHGLDQYRLDGVRVKAAGFTNLSRDHLDYHKDIDSYLAAKSRLFSEILEDGGIAVLNADTPEYDGLSAITMSAGHCILSYGFSAKDLKIVSASPTQHGQNVHLNIMGVDCKFEFPLVGDFQLMNALCALGLVIAQEIPNKERVSQLIKALESLHGVKGRLQTVGGHPNSAAIYVDYAHTPDALEHVLNALHPHTEGKLICLFGCGGDRDMGKRPMMGEIAARLADSVIVTDDNPRSEDPAQIRMQIMTTAPDAQNIEGRAEAICRAVEALEKGDVLVVAGKGHEQGQVFKDHTQDFDDVTEIKKAIKGMCKT